MSSMRWAWPILGWLLLLPMPLLAVITKLTPLKEVLSAEQFIFVVHVTELDPKRPSMILTMQESLKGKPPFERMAVHLTGDSEAVKGQHTEKLLERLAVDTPIIIFSSKRGTRYSGFCFTNGTWFQLLGTADADGKIRWRLLHAEPYLRRTFAGETATLKSILQDALAGKREPPEPDAKAMPGFGPALPSQPDSPPKPEPKPADPKPTDPSLCNQIPESESPAMGSGRWIPTQRSGMPTMLVSGFAVVPTVVLLGPLAILAAVFPTVFGGLALLFRRWLVLLSAVSFISTAYAAQLFWGHRLVGSWWGTPAALASLGILVAGSGAIWAAMRWWCMRLQGSPGELQTTTGDRLLLTVTTVGFGILIGILAVTTGDWLRFPRIEIAITAGMVLAMTIYAWGQSRDDETRLIQPPMAGMSVETLGLIVLTVGMVGLFGLELGRREALASEPERSNESRPLDYPETIQRIVWEYQPDGSGTVDSTPLIANNRVYAALAMRSGFSESGQVIALDQDTGKLVWQFDDDGGLRPIFSSPTLAGDLLLVGEGFHQDQSCRLIAIDANTGKKRWEFVTQSHVESSPAIIHGLAVFGAGNDGVYAVDLATGAKRWHYTGDAGIHVDSNPVISESGLVIFGTGQSQAYQVNAVVALDAMTGQQRWIHRVEWSAYGWPTMSEGRVLIGIGNGNYGEDRKPIRGGLLAIDAVSGSELWRCELPNSVLGKPAIVGNRIVVGCRDGNATLLDATMGTKLATIPLGAPVLASPVFGGMWPGSPVPMVLLVSETGRMLAVNGETAAPLWRAELSRLCKVPAVQVRGTPRLVEPMSNNTTDRRWLLGVDVAAGFSTIPRLVMLSESIQQGTP
ncbi:outer membrane protein assembly factor BamB family protein [Tuwongella immobilis]|uniref:Pyrrolo-quinoline quinone repeat domain-containing protein n=1 Tax=Tuwongella immobilis TaxID=692036 RepID=A0A6C2YR18_9BACT|nr:PQQ-binding-like beta-propeller repeat protein [Tuwongella immobilis]VIP03781.1 PQQ repeat protein OS=Arthrospira platensis (strain NIES-39 / IAM M-135) GN=NIES39_O05180 PE=4 SV=1: PQQ_2: PQQ_3 [Tuwongella immobilis]VTS04930.1 PQQ repeat protein OS=Arthrospira platensis (strain NIES-39 / IAM M-135) GN=NIES39_O05180 PE=4 SV=1: PQQ_2: PQQ_3 [Tuwongella immobilis]